MGERRPVLYAIEGILVAFAVRLALGLRFRAQSKNSEI